MQQTGSGENAVITKVTWTGGKVPTGEDAAFSFLASTAAAKTYTFGVRQTYSDGSVVDWNGPESSDTPSPDDRVEVLARRRRRARPSRSLRSSSARSGRARRRRAALRREARARVRRRADASWSRSRGRWCSPRPRTPRGASAHGPAGERHREHAAEGGRSHLQRGGRATVRDRLGHRRSRAPRDDRAAAPLAERTPTRCSSRSSTSAKGGTSSTGARSPSTATPSAARSPLRSDRTRGPPRSS